MNIQTYSVPKTNGGSFEVTFDTPFANTPVVIVTPYWQDSSQPVGNIETVTEISPAGCTIVSANAAPNDYFVNVLVIDTGRNTIGNNTAIVAGSKRKTSDPLAINFPGQRLNSNDPATLLTSYWQGSTSPVGYYDTLDDSESSGCTVRSRNVGNNYFTQFVGVDLGIAKVDDQNVLAAGIANKAAGGVLRVYFDMHFSEPPTVVVSPWWNDANNHVGYIETVINVTGDYFDVTSGNGASSYFVNWIAFGKG